LFDARLEKELADLIADILGNPAIQCQSDEQLNEFIDRWKKEVRQPWLSSLRDHLLGRFPDNQLSIINSLEKWFNPSKWPSQAEFFRDDFASDALDELIDWFSDVSVYSDGPDNAPRRFNYVTASGVAAQLQTWKRVAFAAATEIQNEKHKSALSKRRAGVERDESDNKSSSSASSSNSSERAGSGSFRNPMLRRTDYHYQNVHGQSMHDDDESCVSSSSFNFSGAPRRQPKSVDRPFPDVTMSEFIKGFHQRPDHRDYKHFCVLMQIAMTLLIHTTSNERGFLFFIAS